MCQEPLVGDHARYLALPPCGGASGPILSRAVAKLIWSTATYLFCRRCSNGGQAATTLQQVRARAIAAGPAFSFCRSRQQPGRETRREGVSSQVKAPESSPLAGSNRLPSPYHRHGSPLSTLTCTDACPLGMQGRQVSD